MRLHQTILFVSDMAAATAFWRDVVGLTVRRESPEWTEFATDGATLALHATSAPAAERESGVNPAGSYQIGFAVTDIHAFHDRMRAHGEQVECVREPVELHGVMLAGYRARAGTDRPSFGVSQRLG